MTILPLQWDYLYLEKNILFMLKQATVTTLKSCYTMVWYNIILHSNEKKGTAVWFELMKETCLLNTTPWTPGDRKSIFAVVIH